jgi:hypothetical protein
MPDKYAKDMIESRKEILAYQDAKNSTCSLPRSTKSINDDNIEIYNPSLMRDTTIARFKKDKRHLEEYPDRMDLLKRGMYKKDNQSFE